MTLLEASPAPPPAAQQISGPRPRTPRGGTHPEIQLLAMVAFGVYLFVGYYLQHVLHYAVGDALARTANANYMLYARDAHFAALGFVWMPIPTVSQLPAMAVLGPLGHASDAGWVTTAMWGAGTILVLGRLCRHLNVTRRMSFCLIIAYTFNPVVAYYAGNGMSEGPLFFFIALTFLGLLRYLSRGDVGALVICGIGAAGCALDRYEAIPLIGAVAAVVFFADWRREGRDGAATRMLLVALPGVLAVAAWFIYMHIIKGSFTAFITDAKGTNDSNVGTPEFLQGVSGSRQGSLKFVLYWMLHFSPVLVVSPLLIWPSARRALGGLGVLAFIGFLPAVTYWLLLHGGSAGDPRYFSASVATGAITAIALTSRLGEGRMRKIGQPVLVALMVLGCFTGATAEQQHEKGTKVEGEYRVFDVLRGDVDRTDTRGMLKWKALASDLDSQLQHGDLVLADVRFSFLADLFSRKPKQFIINNDRDYEATVADPYREGIRIDYLIVPVSSDRGAATVDDAIRTLNENPSAWMLVKDYGVASLYAHT